MGNIEHWERSARLMVAHGDPNPEDPDDVALAGECLLKALGEIDALRQQHRGAVEDNAKLAMAVRYVLHDHRDECPCYGCSTERRYRLGGQ